MKVFKKLFKLKNNEFKLISTRSFGLNKNKDFDIIVKGLSLSIKVRNKIKELLKSPSKRFITSFSYKLKNRKKIKDIIIDDTYSVFTPSIYKLKVNGFLLTYFTKHKGLLSNGDVIEFEAREIELNSIKFSGKGLLIGLEGTESAKTAGKIQAQLINKGEDIGIIDIMIASICITNNETLITRHKKHFEKIPNLKIETY